jgi:CheY-like chemotaxis protein
MSTVAFINSLISSPGRAQLIHQRGTLIFANTAAALAFGIGNVTEFVKFAENSKLFVDASPPMGSLSRVRNLTFRSLDGHRKQALVTEHSISWNGHPSAYLTIDLLNEQGELRSYEEREGALLNEETYFLDSIDSAMDWSRSEGNSYEVLKRPFDFAGVCLRLADDFAHLARQQGVTLNVEVKPRALHVFHGDAAKLVRAASCVVRHAIYRKPGGRVDIILNGSERGDSVSIEVCDTGPSYTAWDAVNLLAPPKVSDGAANEEEIIAPLDLPLAQCIAQFLGGKVTVKVNHPTGGLIRLRFPFQRLQSQRRVSRNAATDTSALRILVAEDNPTSQQVLKIILNALGHDTTFVANGQECLAILKQKPFDVVFMDLHMPVLDGYGATYAIRELETARKLAHKGAIPVLALTADRRPQTRARAYEVGVTGFLTKPIHIPQILGALTSIIENAEETEEETAKVSRVA